jgi:hypothetical protein
LGKWEAKAAKIAADQLIFSSLYTLAFFVSIGLLSGVSDMMELEYRLNNLRQLSYNSPASGKKRPQFWWETTSLPTVLGSDRSGRDRKEVTPIEKEVIPLGGGGKEGIKNDAEAIQRKKCHDRCAMLLSKYDKLPAAHNDEEASFDSEEESDASFYAYALRCRVTVSPSRCSMKY